MNITSRYTDIPDVIIDIEKIPEKFRNLLPLAREWSISDDEELEEYINAVSEEKKRELVDAFSPHFEDLWEWHNSCQEMIPQPDELVLYDIAANAAATLHTTLS